MTLVHRKLWTLEISVKSFLFFCCPEAGGFIRIEKINKEEREVRTIAESKMAGSGL